MMFLPFQVPHRQYRIAVFGGIERRRDSP